MTEPSTSARARGDLTADCSSCAALCCIALAFSRSADFAHDKAAGDPCRHLGDDFSCTIHSQLRERGYKGCTVFDCLGAGQRVTQRTYGGRTWLGNPVNRDQLFEVFGRTRQLHELLWYVDEAIDLELPAPLRAELQRAYDEIDELADARPEELLATDLASQRTRVDELLGRASTAVRSGAEVGRGPRRGRKRIGPRADLMGADLRDADLRGADLRGAYLIAADLRRADLRRADLLGADLRDTDLGAADLSSAIFVTQVQLNAARGDADTVLPAALRRPAHW
jgi:hypothetical protein